MDYYDDYFGKLKPQDDFGWNDVWIQEINKWLEFIYSIDHEFYERNKNRIHRDDHRDAFLGEIKAIYYIGKILGLKIIKLEPSGKQTSKLDFEFEDSYGELWKAEVKAPSWKGQVWKDNDTTKDEKLAREIEPKVRNGDAGSFSSDEEIDFAIVDSVKNSVHKFNDGENNLLIITPNLRQDIMVMLAISAMAGKYDVIQQQVTTYDTNNLISAVLILEPNLPTSENRVVYANKMFQIKTSPSINR